MGLPDAARPPPPLEGEDTGVCSGRERLRFPHGPRRVDFELVDGYDMTYVGWGEQDVDLAVRLEHLGLRCGYAGPGSVVFHLRHASRAEQGRDTWRLLQETLASTRIEAVRGLRDLEDQLTAKRVGASASRATP